LLDLCDCLPPIEQSLVVSTVSTAKVRLYDLQRDVIFFTVSDVDVVDGVLAQHDGMSRSGASDTLIEILLTSSAMIERRRQGTFSVTRRRAAAAGATAAAAAAAAAQSPHPNH